MLTRRECLAATVAVGGVASLPRLAGAVDNHGRPPVGPPWPALVAGEVNSRDGTTIAYSHGGRGAVTVLMVHGWSCNQRFFGPQFAELADSYRFAALDLAGHGASGHRRDHGVPAFADDVAAVAATTSGPLVLLVHSAGGRVACAAADRLGDRLLGIIGIDCFQNLGLPAPDPQRLESVRAAMRSDFDGYLDNAMQYFFPAGSDAQLVSWVRGQMRATDQEQAIGAAAAYAAFDEKAAIAGFDRPVLALNTDTLPADVEAIRALVPHFDARVFPGQGHFLNLAHWESFNAALRESLEQIITVSER